MELRWYQKEAVAAVWDYFESGAQGNPLVALPTGTGKSVVIAALVKSILAAYPETRIIKLTHVKELIAQNFEKLLRIWPLAPAGIYSAGLGRKDARMPITFAGIASVAKKAALFGHIDLVLIDEAHLLSPKESTTYARFLAELAQVNPSLRVIGFTATPYRLGQGLLTDGQGIFTDTCYDLTNFEGFNRLIAEGHLCPLVPKRTQEELDVSGVATVGGEFNQEQLQAAVDRIEITNRAVAELLHHGQDRKHWLVFAAGVEHSDHIAEVLREHGVTAISIHSKMGDDARDKAILDWKAGKYRCAVNNNILTTGIDFPAIDLIGFLRPTKSPTLWVQGLGRGTRPCDGKANCLVLDFAGNTARLGPINDPVIPKKKGKKANGGAPVKCCPQCMTWNHASVRYCTECGTEFVAKVNIREQASTLELIANGDPVVEAYKVDSIEYHQHAPRDGRPPSIRVIYFARDCPLRIQEWLAFESQSGLARHKAREWWRKRAVGEPPDTCAEFLSRRHELAEPLQIQVWVNTKYPEIMAFDFTGQGFAPAG